MAKQLHVIHRHTSSTLNPVQSNQDVAKLALGEIAVQHNASDPAIWIKVGATSASTQYVKFIPAANAVDSIAAEGGNQLEGDVLFASGSTATTAQTTDGVNFSSAGGKMSATIILDKSLDTGSTHAVVNSAVTTAINEVSGDVSALDGRLDTLEEKTITGHDPIVASGSLLTGVTVSHKTYTPPTTTGATTLTNGGSFTGITAIAEDGYGHVTGATATTFTLPTISTEISATGDTYVGASVSNNTAITVTTNAVTALTDSQASGTVADSKAVVDYVKEKVGGIKNVTTIDGQSLGTSADTYNIATGSSLVTKSTAKSGSVITTTIGITTGATSSSTVGLAVNTDVKDYIDKKEITGDGVVIGGTGLTVSHKTVTPPSSTGSSTLTHGGSFTGITAIAEDGYGHVTGATATTFTMPSETNLSTGATSGSGNVVTDLAVSGHQITLTKGITALTAVTATGDSYVDASVSSNSAITVGLKSVADSKEDIAGATTTGSVADAKAVKDYVDDKTTSAVHFKEGTATLPTTADTGDMWVATSDIAIPAASSTTGNAVTAETGDFIIAGEDGKWSVIEKNLTGAVTAGVNLTDGAVVVGNGSQTVKVASAKGDSTHPIYIDASGKPQTANTIHDVTATGTTSAASALTWNTESTLGNVNIDGTDYTFKVKMPANPNTDTATTLDGHYTPASSTTKSASTNYAIAGLQMDAKGHVTGVVDSAHKVEKDVPSDAEFTDTTYTFASGASGSFTVTPAGGSAQEVSIGKPASAGTADNAVHANAATKVDSALTINYGSTSVTFDGSSDQSITIPEVVATDCGNTLAWGSAVTLATVKVGSTTTTIDAQLPANPNTDTATTEDGHYAPSTSASTAGTTTGFIKQVVLDSKKHVVDVVTGAPESVTVVDCAATITTASTTLATVNGSAITANVSVSDSAATIPVNASGATTLGTIAGEDITAKVEMNSLTIAGANGLANGITFNGTTDIEILTLDCGEY